jgi:hypothetical protein
MYFFDPLTSEDEGGTLFRSYVQNNVTLHRHIPQGLSPQQKPQISHSSTALSFVAISKFPILTGT